jgi:hypothetical protein
MGVWDGMWQASQSGLMFVLGAGVLLVVIGFVLDIIGMSRFKFYAQILASIIVVSMVITKLFGLLDTVDSSVKKGAPPPPQQTQTDKKGQ